MSSHKNTPLVKLFLIPKTVAAIKEVVQKIKIPCSVWNILNESASRCIALITKSAIS